VIGTITAAEKETGSLILRGQFCLSVSGRAKGAKKTDARRLLLDCPIGQAGMKGRKV